MEYKELKESDKNGIHEVLFQMDIIGLDEFKFQIPANGDYTISVTKIGHDKVEGYYNQLPEHIKKDGIHWGFSDSVVQDSMCEWFEKNVL